MLRGTHQRVISQAQEVFTSLIRNMCSEITLVKLRRYLPGAYKLIKSKPQMYIKQPISGSLFYMPANKPHEDHLINDKNATNQIPFRKTLVVINTWGNVQRS